MKQPPKSCHKKIYLRPFLFFPCFCSLNCKFENIFLVCFPSFCCGQQWKVRKAPAENNASNTHSEVWMMTYPWIDLSIYRAPISLHDVGSAPRTAQTELQIPCGLHLLPYFPLRTYLPTVCRCLCLFSWGNNRIVHRISIIGAYRYRSTLTTLWRVLSACWQAQRRR